MKEGRVYPMKRIKSTRQDVEVKKKDPTERRVSIKSSLVSPWGILHKQNNAISKWRHYVCSKRDRRHNRITRKPSDKRAMVGQPIAMLNSDLEDIHHLEDIESQMKNQSQLASDRALLIYFAKLARADPTLPTTVVDFDFVDSLIGNGADVNICDYYGQTILHEASRAWHTDVALFLLENGVDINKTDKYGRTALHVAAAVDYPEMIEFLYEHGADLDACTFEENQTPIHYAAKNDAAAALKILINIGADVNCRDYKQRTPLYVAAELDRSATAKLLVSLEVSAGVLDEHGVSALSLMVSKMPPVAKSALDQFHSMDRANRKQYYYLNHLEPEENEHILARTPLEEAVHYKQMDLIMHPVFKRLIQVKWEYFAMRGSIFQVFVQLLFCMLWTTLGVSLPRTSLPSWSYYNPPSSYWWRIVLESFAVTTTALFIWQEIDEVRQSKMQHDRWKKWRIGQLRRDLKYCHPCWPEESKYIYMEISNISSQGLSYFRSYWNFFDWVTYFGILAVILTRILSLAFNDNTFHQLHPRVMSISLIFIWLRLMKVFRPFEALGPFIVMIGHIIKNTLTFGFLFIMFYIPFVCAFWINFGGDENAKRMKDAGEKSEGWRTFNNLMYSVWEITVVGNYPWESLLVIDRTMAQILCGVYLAVSAVICLNLFIALMSDTFQRVYDNANANAVMQKASTILSLEAAMRRSKKDAFLYYIHAKCAPEEMYYDDDSNEPDSGELEKLTNQIHDKLLEVEEMLKTSGEETKQESLQNNLSVPSSQKELRDVIERQNREIFVMKKDLSDIKRLLTQALVVKPESISSVNTTSPPVVKKRRKQRTKTVKKPLRDIIPQNDDEDRSASLSQLNSKHDETFSFPTTDIRRQILPFKDVALVVPQQDLGTNNSAR